MYGADKQEHDQRLLAVLDRLNRTGLTLKEKKCHFGVLSVDYLGHHIDVEGVTPKKELVETILRMVEPTSKDERDG